jgi:hypothetical protein
MTTTWSLCRARQAVQQRVVGAADGADGVALLQQRVLAAVGVVARAAALRLPAARVLTAAAPQAPLGVAAAA